ncbi:hypothetical protein [Niveispirillum fermenti]|uniref:hypothetical protein n=1 Tax=Niveispirillum fermenti TaxID=1233113 RepID=UPI003A8AC422
MAWTEEGYETHVLALRRALRDRMAAHLDGMAQDAGEGLRLPDGGRLHDPHHLRALAERLRDGPDRAC